MSKETKDSIVFYRSFYNAISKFPDTDQLLLFRAVITYGLDMIEPDFRGAQFPSFVEAVWDGIRPQLRANWQRWENGRKGAEFGNRGGAPKGNTNARKQPRNNPKTTPNEKDNVNVNDNVNVEGDGENGALTLPFPDNPEFVSTWNELRNQPRWRKKTVTALKKSLDRLSRYDVRFAVELMEMAISGNYQGVTFQDTPAKYEQWLKSHPQPQNNQSEESGDIYSIYDD